MTFTLIDQDPGHLHFPLIPGPTLPLISPYSPHQFSILFWIAGNRYINISVTAMYRVRRYIRIATRDPRRTPPAGFLNVSRRKVASVGFDFCTFCWYSRHWWVCLALEAQGLPRSACADAPDGVHRGGAGSWRRRGRRSGSQVSRASRSPPLPQVPGAHSSFVLVREGVNPSREASCASPHPMAPSPASCATSATQSDEPFS